MQGLLLMLIWQFTFYIRFFYTEKETVLWLICFTKIFLIFEMLAVVWAMLLLLVRGWRLINKLHALRIIPNRQQRKESG